MNSNPYAFLLRNTLFRLEAETAHELALACLSHHRLWSVFHRIISGPPPQDAPVSVFGLQFRNPVGLAAGMDKNGIALPTWEKLGFGFAEIGTITAVPQLGNPRPRLFRFPEFGALINRMGFNNEGARVIAQRLETTHTRGYWPRIPVGINIGKSRLTPLESAHTDYLESFQILYPHGDYFVINVSSPNTPGLRNLQNVQPLEKILGTLRDWETTASKPLLIKISPDLTPEDVTAIARVCEKEKLAGIVATNTTSDHSALSSRCDEAGGLSGRPLLEKSNRIIRQLRTITHLPIIGSGGILSSNDARSKFDAGANLVQIYTGFVYRGPPLIREICNSAALFIH